MKESVSEAHIYGIGVETKVRPEVRRRVIAIVLASKSGGGIEGKDGISQLTEKILLIYIYSE